MYAHLIMYDDHKLVYNGTQAESLKPITIEILVGSFGVY